MMGVGGRGPESWFAGSTGKEPGISYHLADYTGFSPFRLLLGLQKLNTVEISLAVDSTKLKFKGRKKILKV